MSKVRIGKDVVSRIAERLEEKQRVWRERSLKEKAYPYLYLDATYLQVNWSKSVANLALLACVGINEEDFREVLAVEVVGGREDAFDTHSSSTEKGVQNLLQSHPAQRWYIEHIGGW